MITRFRSWIRAVVRCIEAPLSTARQGCASCWGCWRALELPRWLSNALTGRWWTRCLAAGITVVVISANQVKNLRGRYGSAGNKDDRFDAFVLADTLRTDRARLCPLVPDSPATVALRAVVRARRDLVAHRVALANQLREHLKRVFPGALGLFERFGFGDQFEVFDPIRLPGPCRLADPHTSRRVAEVGALQRPYRPGQPARQADRRPARGHRRRGRRPRPHHPRLGHHPHRPGRPDHRPVRADR